jgi:hypothetical protein
MGLSLGLGLGINASRGSSGAAAFDVTSQAWDMLLMDYGGSPPWAGTASAGDSANQSAAADLDTPTSSPVAGSVLNGHGVAQFAVDAKLKTPVGDDLASIASAGAWTLCILAKPTSIPAAEASPFNNGCLLVNIDGIFGASLTDAGARVWQFDGAYRIANAGTARANEWNLLQAYRTATHLFVRLINETDGVGAWSAGVACGANWGGEPTTFRNMIGTRNSGITSFYEGDIAMIALAKTQFTTTALDDTYSGVASRFGIF